MRETGLSAPPLTCLPASSPRERGEESRPPAGARSAMSTIGEIVDACPSPHSRGESARQGDEGQRKHQTLRSFR
ncbi:hypothetical protein CYK37_15385 [Mesorhizobium loti]|nr:hypothetical protein CYK37_15385 [Mesorhizobium loti]